MLFFKFFLAILTKFPVFLYNSFISKVDPNSFLLENGKLVADCFNKDPSECLSQLATHQSVNKLHLKGFMFNETNVKNFFNTFSQIQDLTLDRCNINDELASLLVLPSGLKSIRLERLNLTSKGIQSIFDDLYLLIESLEVVDCLNDELSQWDPTTNSSSSEASLDLSKFSRLKTINISNLNRNFNSYHFLLSLTLLPLERIKLSRIYLTEEEWISLLKKWKGTNEVIIFSNLKEFNLETGRIFRDTFVELIQSLFLLTSLEIISIHSFKSLENISFSSLPSNIKHFALIPFKTIFMKDDESSFYNSTNLSKLTHLTVEESFEVFPYHLFDLNQLEHLEIWSSNYNNLSLMGDRRCDNLKYLSIQSEYLIPLLNNFKNNFPVIETLVVIWAFPTEFNSHLGTIISCKTLKCLEIGYYDSRKYILNIEGELKSSIEELKLRNVWWEFVSDLLQVERFPYLKKIHIETKNLELELANVFEKLSSFPQLTSITLNGKLSLSNEKLPFSFENLKFFCLEVFQESLDLDLLLSCMPNLIELQLGEGLLRELKVKNSVNICYLSLPLKFIEYNRDFIDIIKNTPNLIQLSKMVFPKFENIPFTSELAYYCKELKRHFNNQLQFKINPACFPIEQLKNDEVLLKLVNLKSPELPNYLSRMFPIDICKTFIKQLFTIGIEKYFNTKSINDEFGIKFFNLLSELEIDNEKDALFVKEFLLEGKYESFTESTDFSFDNFYNLFSNFFVKDIGINLKLVHLEFVKDFFNANKKYGPSKIYHFLKSFFTSLSVDDGQSKVLNDEIFEFFSVHLLAPSFCSLFDKIKENKFSEEERKFLPLSLESIAVDLRDLKPEQIDELSAHFKDILMKLCDESFVKTFFVILKTILIPKPQCSICFDPLFTKECKFLKSNEGNCHLFHRDCLDEWLKENKSCPVCRNSI